MRLMKRSMEIKYTVEQMPNGEWQAESLTQIRRMNVMNTPRATGATRQEAIDNLFVKIRSMVDVTKFVYVKSSGPKTVDLE